MGTLELVKFGFYASMVVLFFSAVASHGLNRYIVVAADGSHKALPGANAATVFTGLSLALLLGFAALTILLLH